MEYESLAPSSYLSYEPTEQNKPEDEIISDILRYMSQEFSELYYNEYYNIQYLINNQTSFYLSRLKRRE